jgi:hypothetical protein
MKKLRLSLESLQVTSFRTVAAETPGHGTIEGNNLDTKCVCDSTRAPVACACSAQSCPTEQPKTCPQPQPPCPLSIPTP